MKEKTLFILGPTSSGKSQVAALLAERINGEVISCDSMQVYKDMDILTRVPEEELLLRVKHHLVGIIPPEEEYNAARFSHEALLAIKSILSRGKVPVFCGGTGLYVKSLLDGLFSSPPKNEKIRKKLGEVAKRKNAEYLHRKLRKIDPEAAERIHPNDAKRIVRALEVYELTGSTISKKKEETKGIIDEYDCFQFGLKVPRGRLYERIERSVDEMFDKGIVREVENLMRREISITAEKALGIKEVSAFLEDKVTVEEARKELKKNTRRYAKRQLTWFRTDKRIRWIDADRPAEEITDDILKEVK